MGFPGKSYMPQARGYLPLLIMLVLWPVIAGVVSGQEEPDEPDNEPETEPAPESASVQPSTSMIHGAGWCAVRSGKAEDQEIREEPVDGEGEDEEPDPVEADDERSDGFQGCDIGVGLSLLRFPRLPRLSWVVVLGSQTLGTGLAWVVSRPEVSGPVIAIAIGLIARYDSGGVYLGEVYPAIGATLSFGRAGGVP